MAIHRIALSASFVTIGARCLLLPIGGAFLFKTMCQRQVAAFSPSARR
jgi:hypothetical protein